MEQMKRQRSRSSENYDDYNKRNRTQEAIAENTCLSRETTTHFEDLSNELIYEIFDFLDYFHVYEAFSNLNSRFRSLLVDSTLPIKINISSMSKSAFNRYNTDSIIPNSHRINSLCVSNLFLYQLDYSPTRILSKFLRLERLILDNVEPYCLENILQQLISLPYLSSLIITSIDQGTNKNAIYRQIFLLRALKYCKLSLERCSTAGLLPVATDEHSSLEHLIIDHTVNSEQIDNLLSYVPRLRRLSFHILNEFRVKQTKTCPNMLNDIKHVSLKLDSVGFDECAQLIINLFPSVEVLHISAGAEYMDANRWKKLISSHLPNLRIFDIRFEYPEYDNVEQLAVEVKMNQFRSAFYVERKWFFEYRSYKARFGTGTILCTTNPYRGKNYSLHKQENTTICLSGYESNLISVDHVYIHTEKELVNCMNYFPNATKLTFKDGFSTTGSSIGTNLNRILPLKQITKLVIECHHMSFRKMIDLLHFTPNIRTLIFQTMPLYKNDSTSIQQSETFQLVSNTNNITDVTFKDECTLEKLKLLVALCPRLKNLTINTLMKDMESIIRFLLETTNPNTVYLSSLCFTRASNMYFRHLNALVKSGGLLHKYTLKHVDRKLYLWW